MENAKRGKRIGAMICNNEKFVTQKINSNKTKKIRTGKGRGREKDNIFFKICFMKQ